MRVSTRSLDRIFRRRGLGQVKSLEQKIKDLFKDGSQGVWYDPSDLTTLFQDSAGTQPVTALEQPVGLMLDKSRGLVLGPERITNGDFSQGSNGWTLGANWSITGGQAVKAAGASDSTLTFAGGFQRGKWYRIEFDIASQIGINYITGIAITASGARRAVFVGYAVSSNFTIYGVSTSEIVIDNISVRELPGYHAFHTPGDTTTRPTVSRRINLLTKTESFDDAVFTKKNVNITQTTATAPDGTATADLAVVDTTNTTHYIFLPTVNDLSSGHASCYVKASGVSKIALRESATYGSYASFDLSTGAIIETGNVAPGSVSNAAIENVGNGWFRISATFSGTANQIIGIWPLPSSYTTGNPNTSWAGNGTSGTYLWGASLVPADLAALPYQRVNTTTDYDSDPSKFPTFLRTDGVNDSLQTNAIDFTGTDKMFVGAAVRKLSEGAAGGLVAEFSANSEVNNGSFYVLTFTDNKYYFRSRGSNSVQVGSGAFVPPASSVVSGIGGISGDSVILRVNGAQAASSTADQGTGNFGNHKLYLFMRGGTSLPFNGWFFGSLIKGATLSASQIALVERWLASKTKTVTLV